MAGRTRTQHFAQYFSNPSDASELMKPSVYTDAQREAEGDAQGSSAIYRGLQHSDTNRRRIFIAARFLKDHLPTIIFGKEPKDPNLNHSKQGTAFKRSAFELAQSEPSLNGVTPIALHATYDRLVEKYHEYQKLFDVETGDISINTMAMEIVKSLYQIYHAFLQLKQTRADLTEKEKKRLKRQRRLDF
ncbi:hypothetical protein BGX27_003492, partial [Mortierella sp. AM989]